MSRPKDLGFDMREVPLTVTATGTYLITAPDFEPNPRHGLPDGSTPSSTTSFTVVTAQASG